MGEEFTTIKVAVVQSSPVLFDREATIEKTCRMIREIGEKLNIAQVQVRMKGQRE